MLEGNSSSFDDYKPVEPVILDDLDKKILETLQENGKTSLRDLASLTDHSVSTVKSRIDRLKDNEVIKRTVAVIDCCKIGYHEMIILSLRLNNRSSSGDIISNLENVNGINSIYQVSGVYPILCMAKCISKEDQINLLETVKAIEGIEEVTTQVVLRRIKEDMRVRIP